MQRLPCRCPGRTLASAEFFLSDDLLDQLFRVRAEQVALLAASVRRRLLNINQLFAFFTFLDGPYQTSECECTEEDLLATWPRSWAP